MKKKILLGLLVILVLIQFIPYHIVNEPVKPEFDFFSNVEAPADVKGLVRDACYDCHSHKSKTPWYGNVAPVKFWLNKHVRGGRQNLDFSNWFVLSPDEKRHALEECVEVLEDREMPLNSYTWLHPEAQLTDQEYLNLIEYFTELNR